MVKVINYLDAIPDTIDRITVAGTTGSGKSTLAAQLSHKLHLPYTEMDSLFWGPHWTVRESWIAEVDQLTREQQWVIEWQGEAVRDLIASRAHIMIWLDYSRWVSTFRVCRRTVSRRLRRTQLWAANTEGPLWKIFVDPDHIIRYSWRQYSIIRAKLNQVIAEDYVEDLFPELYIVHLKSPSQTKQWLSKIAPR